MRKLRQLSMAVVLALAFATTGFAGIIPTVPGPAPPPPEQPSSSSVAASIVLVLVQIAVP